MGKKLRSKRVVKIYKEISKYIKKGDIIAFEKSLERHKNDIENNLYLKNKINSSCEYTIQKEDFIKILSKLDNINEQNFYKKNIKNVVETRIKDKKVILWR